jgi:hypothetical protein
MPNAQFFKTMAQRVFHHPATTLSLTTVGLFAIEKKLSPKDKPQSLKTMFPGNVAYSPVLGPLAGTIIHIAKSLPPAHGVALLLLASSSTGTLAYGLMSTFGPEAYKKSREDAEVKINKP